MNSQRRQFDSCQRHADHPLRFIVFHLHHLSTRLRFLKFAGRHLCAPIPLPALSELLDRPPAKQTVHSHPIHYLHMQLSPLGLPVAELTIETGFRAWVDTPAGPLPLYLARASGAEPFAVPADSQWIELPGSFSLLAIEREILRLAYQWLLE